MLRSALLVLASLAATDSARAQSVVFFEGFESGLGAWTIGPDQPNCDWGHGGGPCSGTFLLVDDTDPCAPWVLPFPESAHAVRFGYAGQCTYEPPGPYEVPDCTLKTAVPIALPADSGSIRLSFWSKSEGEDDSGYDRRRISVSSNGGATFTQIGEVWNSDWALHGFDLTPWAGQSVILKFRFEGGDISLNAYRGWFLDQIVIETTGETGATFCAGDGSAADCPCGNFGASGRGCATSFAPQGARLFGAGAARVTSDTLSLTATEVSNSTITFFQGSAQASFGLGTAFGDGLRCAGGTTVRLRSVPAAANVAQLTGTSGGQPAISTLGAIPPAGGMRTYQAWYRNAADFCTSSTFNLTNGVEIRWIP